MHPTRLLLQSPTLCLAALEQTQPALPLHLPSLLRLDLLALDKVQQDLDRLQRRLRPPHHLSRALANPLLVLPLSQPRRLRLQARRRRPLPHLLLLHLLASESRPLALRQRQLLPALP